MDVYVCAVVHVPICSGHEMKIYFWGRKLLSTKTKYYNCKKAHVELFMELFIVHGHIKCAHVHVKGNTISHFCEKRRRRKKNRTIYVPLTIDWQLFISEHSIFALSRSVSHSYDSIVVCLRMYITIAKCFVSIVNLATTKLL